MFNGFSDKDAFSGWIKMCEASSSVFFSSELRSEASQGNMVEQREIILL